VEGQPKLDEGLADRQVERDKLERLVESLCQLEPFIIREPHPSVEVVAPSGG
jgi:hypothetical protein